MKKLLFMAFAIVVSCIIGSCAAETEETSTAQSKKVNEAKLKIMEMAKDYGLNVRIDEEFLDKYADQIDFDKVEEQFKALASIKGTYRLEKPTETGNTHTSKQMRKIDKRTKTTSKYTYEFEKVEVGGLTGAQYECSCDLVWYVDSVSGKIMGAEADGAISCNRDLGQTYSYITTSIDNEKGVIQLGGYVDFGTNLSTIKPEIIYDRGIRVRFDVTGDYGINNAIIWECDEYAYPYDYNL